jgi:6-pyruvoyltetrahydropterin/6-carboxytetrahydropterin synthase
MLLTKEFKFDAAHYLTKYHGKCENLHGHTYKLQVTIEGKPDHEDMIMDFVELKKFVNEKVIDKLDHSSLNDTFENPSVEVMVVWIWDQLKDLPKPDVKLHEIKLWETETSFVTYAGN